MTDEFDDLKSALRAATPAPDAAKKAENLELAAKNFEIFSAARQETGAQPRLISSRPHSGLWTGARKMLHSLTSRTGLTISTALVAVAFVAFTPLGDFITAPTGRPTTAVTQEPKSTGKLAKSAPRRQLRERTGAEAVPQADMAPLGAIAPIAEPAPSVGTLSYSRDYAPADDRIAMPRETNTETFANADDNPLRVTAEQPVSTFSIDVDTASYAILRDSLMNGYLPDRDSVRIEEMINYFPYDYPAPTGTDPFRATVSVEPTPWNADTRLVHIAIQGALPAVQDRPPLNLVFLIDTSGSMDAPDKLPLLKQSLSLMLSRLHAQDEVAIVAYAGSAGEVLAPTPASDRDTILGALNDLGAGGSTAGGAGLRLAYATARKMAKEGEVSRVILATDGDFNVGISDPEELKRTIAEQRDSGTYLSVLGFGRGNLDDATMQALAQNGNGQAAYIDTLAEAQKVLVDQLTGALFPIADDVKIQVEFNPATIAEYRLIGYETRALRREDFNNDAVDAGEIGAGHQVTALYEITPVGSSARLTDPLRYQPPATATGSDELGFLRLRYKRPGADTSQLIETPITTDLPPLPDTGFAAAIAGFGQLLRGSTSLGDWGYDDAITLANANRGDDPFGYRAEAVRLMRLAETLSR